MKYPRCVQSLYGQAWAIIPEKLWEMEMVLKSRLAESRVETLTALAWDDIDSIKAAVEPRAGPQPTYQTVGRTALIPVFGVISQRMGLMQSISGGTSTESIGRQLEAALADRSVRSIALVIDSPGGSVFGVQELAAKILAAREQKKIVAVADSMAASAAYWLGSQASEFSVTPGGQVGSVGVVAAHQDWSKAEEALGVKTTLIHAGKFKTEGDPSIPLSAEGAATIQRMVDGYYSMFVAGVAKGRGTTTARVEADFGQGRMKLAKDAVAAGMSDNVATLETVLRRLGADAAEAARVSARTASYAASAAKFSAGA